MFVRWPSIVIMHYTLEHLEERTEEEGPAVQIQGWMDGRDLFPISSPEAFDDKTACEEQTDDKGRRCLHVALKCIYLVLLERIQN